MRLRYVRVFSCLLIGFSTASTADLAAQTDSIRAGAAKVDITPKKWPLRLVGSFHERLADKVHDPLHVRALVLGDGTTRLGLAVVDNCLIRRDVLDQSKEIASETTGIPVEKFLISSTHTHSAPPVTTQANTEQEKAYLKQVIDGIAEALVQAHARLEPAKIGWNHRTLEDEVFNRRWFLKPGTMPANPFGETTDLVKMNPGTGPNLIAPAGPIDPEIWTLSFQDQKGKPFALFANYPLHYVGGVPREHVSADYFGEFARLLPHRLRVPSENFVGVLSNGTSGDINNINFRSRRPPREPFEQIRAVASKVADVAYESYRSTTHRSNVDLAMVERKVLLEVRKPDEDLVNRCRNYLKKEDGDTQLPRLAKEYAERVLRHLKEPDEMEFRIQAIRIGELAICSLPFEVIAEIGLELKARSPFPETFVVELANGAYGYLPTKEQHAFGGYETWLTTSRVQKDASDILVNHLLEMLSEIQVAP